MCYYNSVKVKKQELKFILENNPDIEPYTRDVQSGFEYDKWPIIKSYKGNKEYEVAHWEFIPFWLKDMEEVKASRKKYTTLNAKGETLLTSKIYKEAALQRRCVVLSSGFYEWRHYMGKTYPYFIRINEKPLFAMAGVYQPWIDKSTGETFDTFAIVTTAANELMTQVHNNKKRMPVLLTDEYAKLWLQPDLSPKDVEEIANFHTTDLLEAKTIIKDFTVADNPQQEQEYPELPPLTIA